MNLVKALFSNFFSRYKCWITIWQAHSPEKVKVMKEGLAKLKEQDIKAIEDLEKWK